LIDVQGKKRLLKKRSPQHNKPTNPNNEVPPQDAQLQGVVSMASTQIQTQTVKCLHKMRNFKGLIKDKCKIQQKSLQGQVRNFKWTKIKQVKASKGKRDAQLLSKLVNHPQMLNKIACKVT
jgi:heme-binding NEAT domain protein